MSLVFWTSWPLYNTFNALIFMRAEIETYTRRGWCIPEQISTRPGDNELTEDADGGKA